jgi:hypothetical protein
MTSYERSAMIGYYRSGATVEEISLLCGVSTFEVEKRIHDYLLVKGEKPKPIRPPAKYSNRNPAIE